LKLRHDLDNIVADDDDDYGDDVALRGEVAFYRAFAPFSDVIRDKESKEACENRHTSPKPQVNLGLPIQLPHNTQQSHATQASASALTTYHSHNNNNAINRNEFASAMGKVNQLQNNFGNTPAQLATLTKFLSGANTQ